MTLSVLTVLLTMEVLKEVFDALILFMLILEALFIKKLYDRNPFKFPYYTVDVSDPLTEYLHTPGVMETLEKHVQVVEDWKGQCEAFIKSDIFKTHRRKQYEAVAGEKRPFKINGKPYHYNELWNIYIGQLEE